ncbi:MAG TPA: hypothetical protein VKV26_04455 [Dehalococcoidia bacterium]|nr:hypothetical protein [Dehalococcoidia bacterium]
MSRRAEFIPACVAAAALALNAGAGVWAALPLHGSMGQEFAWPNAALILVGAISLAATGLAMHGAVLLTRRAGVRTPVTAGSLAGGLLLLLALPNLTHLWQLTATLILLGLARAAVLAGGWQQLRHALPRAGAWPALAASLLAGLGGVTPWLSAIVYRNSWREGAAACAGLLLLLAAPLSYVLLPGREPGCGCPRPGDRC